MNDKRSKAWQWLRRGAAGILSLMLVFSLIQPGMASAEETYVCGKTEHAHDDSCYETVNEQQTVQVLSCVPEAVADADESEAVVWVHDHAEECYEGETLVCPLEEVEEHTHGDDCYELTEELQCGKKESDDHEHDAAECHKKLTCEKKEIILHEHKDECYIDALAEDGTETKQLVCGETEVVEHVHGDSCYTEQTKTVPVTKLTCKIEEHTHDDSCKAQAEPEPTPSAAVAEYEAKLADLEARVKALDVEAADFATKWEALAGELGALEEQMGADKGAGIITPEEHDPLFAKLDEILNLLYENMPGDGGDVPKGSGVYSYAEGNDYLLVAYPETASTAYLNTVAGNNTVIKDYEVERQYRNIVLGKTAATSVEHNIPNNDVRSHWSGYGYTYNYDHGGNYDYGGPAAWHDSKMTTNTVKATDDTRAAITDKDNPYSAYYTNVGTVWVEENGKQVAKNVDVKLSLVDFLVAPSAAPENETNKEPGPSIGFVSNAPNSIKSVPGVVARYIRWLRVKYEFYYTGTDDLVEDAAIKGSTSYSDIDGKQGVHMDSSTKKITMLSTTGGGHLCYYAITSGSQTGPYVHCSCGSAIVDSDDGKFGTFTECFEGNSFVRTFRFESSGLIYHSDTSVEPLGELEIMKADAPNAPDPDKEFTFRVWLDTSPEVVTNKDPFGGRLGDVNFTPVGGVNTTLSVSDEIKLKYGESVFIRNIDHGVKYTVMEIVDTAHYDVGVTSTNEEGIAAPNNNAVNYTDPTYGAGMKIEGSFYAQQTETEDSAGNKTLIVKDTKKETFTNTRKMTGKAIIKKVVETNADSTTFTFTAELKDGTQKITFPDQTGKSNVSIDDDVATITLTANTQVELTGLPVGATLHVTEATKTDSNITPEGKYEVVGDKTQTAQIVDNSVTNSEPATITFTNTRKMGDLLIKKDIRGVVPSEGNQEFTYDVYWNDTKDFSKKPNHKEVKVTAFGDGTKVENIPYGAYVMVVEQNANNYDVKVNGEVVKDATYVLEFGPDHKDVTFTNTQKGMLSITKTVEGTPNNLPTGENALSYTIQVNINGKPLAGVDYFDSATATTKSGSSDQNGKITLKAGQTAVFKELPVGVGFTVTEDSGSRIGFGDVVYESNVTDSKITTDAQVTVKNQIVSKSVQIPVSKLVPNYDGTEKTYNFMLTGEGISPMLTTVTVKDKKVTNDKFGALTYSTDDLYPATDADKAKVKVSNDGIRTRTYEYTVTEVATGYNEVTNGGQHDIPGIFADTQEYKVYVTLTGDTTGLHAEYTKLQDSNDKILKDANDKPLNPVFENIVLKDLTIQKNMAKDSVDIDGTYYMKVEITSDHFKQGMVLDLGYKETDTAANKTYTVQASDVTAKKITLENIPVTVGEDNAVTIKGIPYGSTYKITETSGYGYTTEDVTGTVGNNTVAAVTNTEMTAVTKEQIKIKKSLPNSDGGKYSYKFALTEMELKDGVLVESANKSNNQIKEVEFKGKEGEVSFDALTYKTSDLLNVDAVKNTKQKVFYYRITELPAEDELVMSIDETKYTVKVLLTAGTHTLKAEIVGVEQDGKDLDDLEAISFTNTLLGSLTVNKRVVGGDKDHAFKFRLTVDKAISGDFYAEVNGKETTFTIKDGIADFWLGHKDEITIYGLPHGLKVEIYEYAGDYYPYHKVDSQRTYEGRTVNTVFDASGTTVKYTNYADSDMLPQTGQLKWPILVLGVLGAGFLGFGVLTKKRKRNGK